MKLTAGTGVKGFDDHPQLATACAPQALAIRRKCAALTPYLTLYTNGRTETEGPRVYAYNGPGENVVTDLGLFT